MLFPKVFICDTEFHSTPVECFRDYASFSIRMIVILILFGISFNSLEIIKAIESLLLLKPLIKFYQAVVFNEVSSTLRLLVAIELVLELTDD